MTAFAAGHCPGNGGREDENDSFDPGPIDSDVEQDLFPPDPHENWIKERSFASGRLEDS